MLLGVVFLSEFGLEHLLTSDNRAFIFVLDNLELLAGGGARQRVFVCLVVLQLR